MSKPQKTKPFTCILSPELINALKKDANIEGRTASSQLRVILSERYANLSNKHQEK